MLQWLHTEDSSLQHEAFILLVEIIQHSYSAMDPPSTKALSIKMCELCLEAVRQHNVKGAKRMLTFFDAMVQHGNLPGSQKLFISTLCCLVNLESHAAWKIMKKLLSGNCGHQGIYELLLLLDSPKANTANVLRGAVFFVGMSSWGSQVTLIALIVFNGIMPASCVEGPWVALPVEFSLTKTWLCPSLQ
jgi:hypothetical protein